MRQGGFKPKSHKSGTYWVRANAAGGRSSSTETTRSDEMDEADWAAILGAVSAIIFFGYVLIIF